MSELSPFRSPTTGRALRYDTRHSLSDGEFERWPMVEGIPYLRTESEGLAALALSELDAGNPEGALVALLTDQDAWWPGPPTDLDELRELVRRRDSVTLREAMALLRYGAVGDYFAHHWSDPTFLAGLALLEAHWNGPKNAFELAGGIGHYARELTRRGVSCLSADIVFSKCWLAKQFVAPDAEYVVFDAKNTWPVAGRTFDLVHCQDAFYFLPDPVEVADRLRSAVADGGTLAVGHLHNDAVEGGAFGPARSAQEWQALFPDAQVYDERELRRALLSAERPVQAQWTADPQVEAWAIVEGGGEASPIESGLAVPPDGAELRVNPLLGEDGPVWPSERYAAEYGPEATWTDPASPVAPDRDRRLVDLPERW